MKFANVALLASLVASVSALHIPLKRRSSGIAPIRSVHRKRASPPDPSDPYYFQNVQNILYVGTVYIDDQPFEVQLDSGSSDLWIDSTGVTFTSAQDTNVEGSIAYLDTSVAQGPILITNVTFANWTSPTQAFISAVGTNATTLGDKGLLGVGPPTLSSIATTLNGTQYNGNSFLDNVFNAYPDDPNVITFLLSRNDVGVTDGGDFTIGTIVPGYEDVLSTPQLPVISDSEWQTVMDGITVNGTFYYGDSLYLNGSQVTVLIDSGTSFGTATRPYTDALYSQIPGALWDDNRATYFFPCDSLVEVTMQFGNITIPIDPIDLGYPDHLEADGTPTCIGTFSVNDGSGVDLILGDSFMRNVYSVFYFGEWTTADKGTPYMQLLPVTNPFESAAEFTMLNNQRVQSILLNNTSSDPSSGSGGSSSGNGTDSSVVSGAVADKASASDSSSVDLSGINRNSYIIMGLIGIVIILLAVNLVMLSRKNRGYRQIGAPGSLPPTHFVDKSYSTPYEDHDR